MEKQLVLKSPIPDFKESETFDSSKVVKHNMFYFFDRKFAYVMSDFELFQHELSTSIKLEVWVKIDIDLIINIEKYISDPETVIKGILYSPLYFYQETKGMKVDVVFTSGEIQVPKIRPLPENKMLYKEYIEGVEKYKFLRWYSFLTGKLTS